MLTIIVFRAQLHSFLPLKTWKISLKFKIFNPLRLLLQALKEIKARSIRIISILLLTNALKTMINCQWLVLHILQVLQPILEFRIITL